MGVTSSLRSDLSVAEIKQALEKANNRVIDYLNEAKRVLYHEQRQEHLHERLRYVKLGIDGMRQTSLGLAEQKQCPREVESEIKAFSNQYATYVKEIEKCLQGKIKPTVLIHSIDAGIGYLQNRVSYLEKQGTGVWKQQTYAEQRKQSQSAAALYQQTIAHLRKRLLIVIVHIEQNFGNAPLTKDSRARLLLQERRMENIVNEFQQTKEMIRGYSQRADEEVRTDSKYFEESLRAVKAAVNGRLDQGRLWAVMRTTQAYLERVVPEARAKSAVQEAVAEEEAKAVAAK